MAFRILCIGDVHLGRKLAHLPSNVNSRAVGPASAWDAFVQAALDKRVDAVVLTGDIVDESNKFYEAYSHLQRGVRKLVDADIPILAVAGNHDFDVLGRLADEIPGFWLLGRGETWNDTVVTANSSDSVKFVGWSFANRHVGTNPLATCPRFDETIPIVGILHCDCFSASSVYAPVSLQELKTQGPGVWLLGHIHGPQVLSDSSPLILYTGSPQGLDPSETGEHGAWLIELEPAGTTRHELVSLAKLRWENIDVSLDKVDDSGALEGAVIDALRSRHEEIRASLAGTILVGCRLRFTGRTKLHRSLTGEIDRIKSDLRPPLEETEYFVEKIENQTRPDIDLENVARSNDPAGLLARRLMVLDEGRPDEEYNALLQRARPGLDKQRATNEYASLPDNQQPLSDERIRDLLFEAGIATLDKLLSKEPDKS
jgi:DNA repair exonuclease SbcCD nuclease subunit